MHKKYTDRKLRVANHPHNKRIHTLQTAGQTVHSVDSPKVNRFIAQLFSTTQSDTFLLFCLKQQIPEIPNFRRPATYQPMDGVPVSLPYHIFQL